MENDVLEKLLFNRSLIGIEFATLCRAATRFFLEHVRPEVDAAHDDISELTVLTKGLYYDVRRAFVEVFARNLEANFIATKRVSVQGGTVEVEVPYSDFSAPTRTLIIADTIASGATLSRAIEHYAAYTELRTAIVFSVAGSTVGARVLSRFCKNRGINLVLVYSLAAFGLAENGFDLAFLHPDTRCISPEYLDRARRVFENKPVSAVGWDFGSQVQSIRKYKMLCWLESEYWNMQDSAVFALREHSSDPRLVEKERAAYEQRV
jgi:hypothetical protein